MAPRYPPLTLFVESRKAITSFYRPPHPSDPQGGADIRSASTDVSEGEAQYFLSDDQAGVVALVEELARRRGYSVDIKDVAKQGRIDKFVTEHLRNVTDLPVLVTHDGRRLEGVRAFTEERICELMPAELPAQRAFTYVKIRGGDFDAVRGALLHKPEVKEIHFLTGDWDAFIVLEFRPSQSAKREILSFVTTEIRSLGSVADTSTLVPEVSVTKFPI
jgi:DNA-binding Lrp family transcriptional regulator